MLLQLLLSSFLSFSAPNDSIVITDSIKQDSITLNQVIITGNKKTKERILLRELTVKLHQNYARIELDKEIKQSSNNIFNTGLVTFVTVKDSLNTLYIDITEKWYIWPIPIIEFADQNVNAWWKTRDIKRLNYGVYLAYRNFTGNRDYLFLRFQTGFTDKYETSYNRPNFDKKQQFGLFAKTFYTKSKKQSFDTKNDKLFFPNIDSKNHTSEQFFGQISFSYRNKIFVNHNFSAIYSKYSSSDSIAIENPNFLGDGKTSLSFLQLKYTLTYDKRDSKSYPLAGYLLEGKASHYSLFNAANIYDISGQIKKYYGIIGKLKGASSLKIKVASNFQQPYVIQGALGYSNLEVGYNNNVRSYEFNVIDGQHYFLAKTGLKFPLLVNKVTNFEGVTEKFGKIPFAFYLTSFVDAGYVKNIKTNPSNNLNNTLLLGYGIGINYATYYDLVYRLEFSLNRHGKSGIFMNFVVPI